ncbi:hypothetical protein [Streptomyces sp. NPDC002573]|uniref:DUF6197 family protein n=1 Tax=Streptomyces sp. NPDC002573 TaxID=3364651 RepID=UPI0036834222
MSTTPAPARHQSAPAADQPAARADTTLSLDARLAAIDAAMAVQLDVAAVAYEVRTAHIHTDPVDLADIVTVPVDTEPAPLADLYPTPVAALLQRAHHRLISGGWCKDALVDEDGARCMLGAIRAEAGGNRGLETDAVAALLDAIRREFGADVDSVPGFNDAWANGRVPIRMVDRAARLADARSL